MAAAVPSMRANLTTAADIARCCPHMGEPFVNHRSPGRVLGIIPYLMKSQPGRPMTLGNAAAACVRLIVWCKACRHRVELGPGEMSARYGASTSVPDWRRRLVCASCGGRDVDMVVSGTER
jgi:hypothetical protein